MPPSGEGVNTAMLDALDLSEYLTGGTFVDLHTAIAAFETRMRERAVTLGREALESIQDFASPTAESIQKLLDMFN